HERPPLLDLLPAAEAELAVGELGVDPSVPKVSEPTTVLGMRIELTGDDTRDPGLEQRLDARRRRSAVPAGLERDVDPGAASARPGCLERDDLGVRAALPLVPALADDLVAGDDHRADDRIRMRRAAAVLRELDGALQEADLHAHDPKLRPWIFPLP